MDPAALLRIAEHWGPPHPQSTPRSVDLPANLRPDLALVIQGVRRAGKSTLMTQLPGRYGLPPERCFFLNFEDPRIAAALDHELLTTAVEAFESTRGRGATFFFDEIQQVTGWQRWLRTQLDRPADRRFVITGSNAQLLAGELGSSLTGRHLSVELFPFDQDEYRTIHPDATLESYLESGGFPAALAIGQTSRRDADQLLRSYFNDIIERDVREHVGARSSQPLRQLTQILFESAGSEFSIRRLANAIGMSVDTASLYLAAIENAYLGLSCPYFAWSERKRSVRNRKYYPIDTGLRRATVTRTGKDRGKMLECAAFVLLRRRFGQVYYWRGRNEVDFVVLVDNEPIPIQVTWDEPTERHHKGVDEFQREHPTAREACFVTAESYAAGVPELLPS